MAEALTPAAEREEAAREVAARRVPFGGRLMAAYAVVVLAFGGALALFTVLATRDSARGSRWSSWQPTDGGSEGAGQIAARIGKHYRAADDGQQVAFVTARFPLAFSQPITHVAVRDTNANASGSTVEADPTNKTLFYEICGVGAGTRCNLPSGFGAGELSMRREALELALYSFKYLDNVDTIVVFLPPAGEENTAVFFRERWLHNQLRKPLAKTLPLGTPPGLGAADPDEQDVIDGLTTPHWLHARFQQGPVLGTTTLVLDNPVEQEQP